MRQYCKAFVLAVVSLLAGCGQPVCFMGAGDCAAMYANPPSSTSTSGNLVITGQDTAATTERPTYTTTGGSGTYTWSIVSPANCGSFPTSSSGVFTPSIVGSCTIQAIDNSTPTAKFGTKVITIR